MTRMPAGVDHHLEGARVEEVADQHAGGVAEQCVGGRAAAPQRRFVDHVVVQQGGGVDELDHRRQLEALARRRSRGRSQNSSTSAGRMRLPPALMM